MTHNDLLLDIKGERRKKHAIYMMNTLHNGLVLKELRFIDGSLSLEEAEKEAIRIVQAQSAGNSVKCVVIPDIQG